MAAVLLAVGHCAASAPGTLRPAFVLPLPAGLPRKALSLRRASDAPDTLVLPRKPTLAALRMGGWGDDRGRQDSARGGYNFGPPPRGRGEVDEPRNDRLPPWERGDDGTAPQAVEDSVILSILSDREVARRRKDFDEADRLRDQLLGDHMIHVDDRSARRHFLLTMLCLLSFPERFVLLVFLLKCLGWPWQEAPLVAGRCSPARHDPRGIGNGGWGNWGRRTDKGGGIYRWLETWSSATR